MPKSDFKAPNKGSLRKKVTNVKIITQCAATTSYKAAVVKKTRLAKRKLLKRKKKHNELLAFWNNELF
ncbi:hypothetical protein Leryth_015196 [Lithospermum erythrorhizon]|nr:hypothetical protein Leryth_015196 [Lithospermum erythrorhizon]